MIRPAAFADIPRLAELMQEIYEQSRYRSLGFLVDHAVKDLFMYGVNSHGGVDPGSTLLNVAEADGTVQGFLFGILDRVYHVGNRLMATDLFFYQSKDGHARDAIWLLDDYLKWAESNPGVILIRQGRGNALPGDPKRIGKLYDRRGFHHAGEFYEKEINQ